MLAYENVPADLHLKDTYIPDMVWFAAASQQGLVLCFEGAQLFNKIDRGTLHYTLPTSCFSTG